MTEIYDSEVERYIREHRDWHPTAITEGVMLKFKYAHDLAQMQVYRALARLNR
jgi:hypothetical protein